MREYIGGEGEGGDNDFHNVAQARDNFFGL